ncbi:hypothetical protein Z043_122572 [Scleropages formosus]|uniref:Uncharacterized protein n=1 Tax=Scleropages formosus TaxID=113540 RepID=A0A0P7TFC8_SCLFO|nr:hypothetical protein Z043_122572 [Scleropages formosus]
MARNEEKQLGRLNRLWLQKEREEGRIKDLRENRPKLSSLNTASALKKWIPTIKSEMEYYLQQSQLSHYPERKITEFHKHLEELEREYKLYLRKLRTLDPTYKHHPWTPRPYAKKRQTEDNPPSVPSGQISEEGTEYDMPRSTGNEDTPASEKRGQLMALSSSITSTQDLPSQDQPLSFNMDRMPLILARSQVTHGSLKADSLAEVLLSGLPNLHSCPRAQALAAQKNPTMTAGVADPVLSNRIQQSMPHVLRLSCYSSSDEDT